MAKRTKAPAYVPVPQLTEAEKTRKEVDRGVASICALLPEMTDETQELLDAALGEISESLDILVDIERTLTDDLNEAKKELKDAEEAEEEAEEEARERYADDLLTSSLVGLGRVRWEADNMIDEMVMQAFGALLAKGRPHELLRTLEKLAEPRIAAAVAEVIDTDEMVYG